MKEMGKFDNIKCKPMEYKVKWFLPLSFTKKYKMFASFMELFRELGKNRKKDVTIRRTHRQTREIRKI